MGKIEYVINSVKWFFIRALNHYIRPKRWKPISKWYAKKKLLSVDEGIKLISNYLKQDQPFMIARFGSTELEAMTQGFAIRNGMRRGFTDRCRDYMQVLAGFFPSDDINLSRFSELMLSSLPCVDALGVWYNPNEDYFVSKFMRHADIMPIAAINELSPEFFWLSALVGKKVVVVSPFKDTILSQYRKRKLLFADSDYLPDFNLRVVKAVQTAANNKDERFSDWFEALEYLYQEIMKEDFDIALLGCGAYGFPLAAKIKQAGRSAIHVGGGLQLFFGIKGGKWDDTYDKFFYNEFWVRPSADERPKDFKVVENGCYW